MSWIERKKLLNKIEKIQDSKVILYVTGDRRGQETIISSDALDFFVEHLDRMGISRKISLILYTRGGDGMTSWSLINLIKMFCDELEIIIPMKAHSAGTMLAIGADKIIMTKQATLSPIDPSINHPLAPQIIGTPIITRAPVSVEAIQGYLDLANDTIGKENDQSTMGSIMLDLSRQIHPLVLGDAFRRRQQTRLLAGKLLAPQVKNDDDRKKIIDFLSSDSGSHDYTLNRREASALGLRVEKCSAKLYTVLRKLYEDFCEEMKLRDPFNPALFQLQNGSIDFSNIRATIESRFNKPVQFITEGRVEPTASPQPTIGTQNNLKIIWEGWRKIQ